jgi:hypothetical protein
MQIGSKPEYRPRPGEGAEVPVSILSLEKRDLMIWKASEPVAREKFPPCIRNILASDGRGKGKNRAAAVLASFLGQAGWGEAEARELWKEVAGRFSLEGDRIFEEWFGKMNCPRCDTIKSEARGYPRLGLGGLGYCQPDEKCPGFLWPAGYAVEVSSDQDMIKGSQILVKTTNLARVFDWNTGREGVIELSDQERDELAALVQGQGDMMMVYTRSRIGRRLRPRFFLKENSEPRRSVLSEML